MRRMGFSNIILGLRNIQYKPTYISQFFLKTMNFVLSIKFKLTINNLNLNFKIPTISTYPTNPILLYYPIIYPLLPNSTSFIKKNKENKKRKR